MNTNRGGQGSSSRAGHGAPCKGTSEAGGSRDQGKSPSSSRHVVSLNRDVLRKSLAQKKQVGGSSTAAAVDRGQAAATAEKGQAVATASRGQAAATDPKGKASAEKSSSDKGKEKRKLEDTSRPPRPNKVRVTEGPEDDVGASSSASAPVGEILLGGIYVPAWRIREGSSVLTLEVASEMFEHSCLLRDLQQLSVQGLHVVMDEFASCWGKGKKISFVMFCVMLNLSLTSSFLGSWLL